jgi:hypothetical protein
MDLRLRPRNPWEALDLGLELVRAHWRGIYSAWLTSYVPVAAIVFACLWDQPFWAWLAMWWLKPLYDRIALAVMSRRLFGETATTREVLRSTPRCCGGAASRRAHLEALRFARSLHRRSTSSNACPVARANAGARSRPGSARPGRVALLR